MTRTAIPAPDLLTETQRKKKERDLAILTDLVRLMKANPGRARTPVYRHLMARYEISSLSGFYAAIERAYRDEDTPEALRKDCERYYLNK